jgi:cbb3-type cytochrome oxidase maturation protein
MGVVTILIIVSFGMAFLFLAAFVWAVRNSQFDDTYTPSIRIILDDINEKKDSRTN